MSNLKTYRATEQGYHAGLLINPQAVFEVDVEAFKEATGSDFAPNWAEEVATDHTTPTNVGEQEQLNLEPALPEIADPAQPLPTFHPAVNVPSEAAQMSVDQANAENADPATPVKTTAELLAEQAAAEKPKRHRRTKAEIDADKAAEDAKNADKAEGADDGSEFTS